MKSCRYLFSGRTPHNFDDLFNYCCRKDSPVNQVVVSAVVNKNNSHIPTTGTEYSFSLVCSVIENKRSYSVEFFGWTSNSDSFNSIIDKNAVVLPERGKVLSSIREKVSALERVVSSFEIEPGLKKIIY